MELPDENPFAPTPEARARAAELSSRLGHDAPEGAAQGLRAVVVGAGKSGLSAARLLRQKGADVTIADDRPAAALADHHGAELPGVRFAPLESESLRGAELVVLSPGVPRTRPALAESLARDVVVGEMELGAWCTRAPLVGITGTNGKSTTTALVGHLLFRSGLRVFAGGNLGRPLTDLAVSNEAVDVAVVEVSSYQLESIVSMNFDVACWLNLTPDHLDRYADLASYALAKRRILEQRSLRGVAVLNAMDPIVAALGDNLGGSIRWFGAGEPERGRHAVEAGTFAEATGQAVRRGRAPGLGDRGERFPLENPRLVGLHNRSNMTAAIECARLAGATVQGVAAGLADFPGLPHRIELVGELEGVRYYNDSKATNVDSAVIAARAVPGPKILIAGGRDKGGSWAPLVDAIRGELRAVLAIGEAAPLVLAAFADAGAPVEDAGTLAQAIDRARAIARPGDAVVLAPACSSFDQFKNYEDRGDRFRRRVAELIQEGQP